MVIAGRNVLDCDMEDCGCFHGVVPRFLAGIITNYFIYMHMPCQVLSMLSHTYDLVL